MTDRVVKVVILCDSASSDEEEVPFEYKISLEHAFSNMKMCPIEIAERRNDGIVIKLVQPDGLDHDRLFEFIGLSSEQLSQVLTVYNQCPNVVPECTVKLD